MTTLTEGNLQITFPDTVNVRRFDDPKSHGLGQYMKAVDFIVEDDRHIQFIEFKDPDHPHARSAERDKFINGFHAGKLDEDLKYKYRDSFLYEWASGNTEKPIYYWVLICIDSLTEVELLERTNGLKRKLPLFGPSSGVWMKKFVEDCMVFNLRTWNRHMSDFPIARLRP